MQDNQYILEIKEITKRFPGVTALRNASLAVRAGEVLGLVGENGAGKSTMMNILLGSLKQDEGTIFFKGQEFSPKSPADALNMGISMIHQELMLIPQMSVAENIWMGREDRFTKRGLLDVGARDKAARELLNELEIEIKETKLVFTLSRANMQLIALARAVSYDSDVIIMDEPTSALTNSEIKKLFKIIKRLASNGKSIIFITHKLDELYEICDTVTVLRDGSNVASKAVGDVEKRELISMMVGREIKDLYPKEAVPIGDVIFRVEGLSNGPVQDVSFAVRSGEVLGFCGLMGAGRTEIMQSIFGIDPKTLGRVYVDGNEVSIKSTKQAIEHGIAMVTEDRLRKGAIHKLSVLFNVTISAMNRFCKFNFINTQQEIGIFDDIAHVMNVKMSNRNQDIGSLSGGNQQKAIIAKWLLTEPKVLILDEPTRGIDVGSKAEIYKLINQMAAQGKAIIVVSSELPEVMGIADRILIVRGGRIVAEVQREDFDQEIIMQHAFGL